jgi:O-antigen ligase/thioredoxin-like negative regulator of GroEL
MPLKKIIRAITVTALFLLPLFPLIVANSFFFPFITGKAFFFRILVEIAFAGWIMLCFMDAKYRPKWTALTIGVTAFALIALVADLLGVNPLRSIWSNFERMEGWMTIVHLWALFLVISNVFGQYAEEGKKMWHRWFATNLGVATVVSVYGLLQIAGVVAIHQGSVRVDASLGNSAYMGVYMLFSIGLAVFMFLSSQNRWSYKISGRDANLMLYWAFLVLSIIVLAIFSNSKEITGFFSALSTYISTNPLWFIIGLLVTGISIAYPYRILPLLFTYIIFQTQTRGTILGLIGGILLALFLYAILAKKEPKTSRYISGGVIVAIILVGIIFWTNRQSSFVQNSPVLNRLATISISDVKTQARGYIWPMAISGAMERPLLGWGQENFNYIFNANYEPKMYAQEQWFDRAHSVFLDWLVAAGIIGFVAYLSLYVLLLMKIWKSGLTIAEKSTLTGLVVGYAIHNVFVFDNIASYIMFFAILAFADSQTSIRPSTHFARSGQVVSIFGTKSISKDAVEYVVAPIVIVCFVLVVYFSQYRVMNANSRLIDALVACSGGGTPSVGLYQKALAVGAYTANQEIREQLLSCGARVITAPQAPNAMKQEFFTSIMDEVQNQIAITPKDARIYTLAGSFMNNIGQFQDALPLLEKAHQLSPNKQSISFELITTYINLGTKIEDAIKLAKTTYESAKDHDQAKFAYATTLIIGGKEAEAKELFKDNLSALNSPQIAQAYVSRKEYNKAIEIYKGLVKGNPNEINYRAQLAQTQYIAGLKYEAIETLRTLAKDKPELKAQVEAAIKQMGQ